jgi:hypothetical protein
MCIRAVLRNAALMAGFDDMVREPARSQVYEDERSCSAATPAEATRMLEELGWP